MAIEALKKMAASNNKEGKTVLFLVMKTICEVARQTPNSYHKAEALQVMRL